MNRIYKWAALIVFALSGCASVENLEQQRSEYVNDFIEEHKLESKKSVTSFKFHSWNYINYNHIIISTHAFKPYLIKLKSDCRELRFSQNLKVNNTHSTLNARFDSVQGDEPPHIPCYIEKIYPIDREQQKALTRGLSELKNKS